MLADGAHIHRKQLGHQLLRQPDGIVLVARLDALLASLGGEDQELGGAIADQLVLVIGHGCHYATVT